MEMFTSRREGLIEHRQVSDYQRQHAEPDAGLRTVIARAAALTGTISPRRRVKKVDAR